MAAQSPIARFFVPKNSPPISSPPQTPAQRAESKGPESHADVLSTPPSVHARKRCLTKQADEGTVKKLKENTAVPAVPAAEAPVSTVASPSEATDRAPSDLKATLSRAATGSGALSAFVAECFHHYESGQQYSWPEWLKPENLKDLQGLRPTDPGYNSSSLWVPDPIQQKGEYQKAQGHNTPMLMQYWKLKSTHFDKVAFFKVGKFYEIFYYDAFIAQRVCGLKWMSQDKKPHVGFPEMAKHEYAKQILAAGFKVVVVEQVERVVETNQRKSEANGSGSGAICVERAPCEVFTGGTLVDPELLQGAGARFLAYIHFEQSCKGLDFALCLVDCATSQFQLGRYEDSADRNTLRTLVAQVQPSEVVYDVSNLPSDVLNYFRRLPYRPQLSAVKAEGATLLAARDRLRKYRQDHPKILEDVENLLTQDSATMAASGLMDYLTSGLLSDRLLPVALWSPLSSVAEKGATSTTNSTRMVLDATALAAIEVVESLEGRYEGSLLSFLDHTSTPMGFRLLRQWLCAPLYDLEEIHQRQEAVEFFIDKGDLAQQLRQSLKRCIAGNKIQVDLERATSRIWSYALQAERRAVMYEDVTARRLGHFVELMQAFEQCYDLLLSAFPNAVPGRLAMVAKQQKDGGTLPDLLPVIRRLKGALVEVPLEKGTGSKFRPQDGADPIYDEKCREIQSTQQLLDQELEGLRQKFPKVSFCFQHRLPGYRYEVECDEQAIGSHAKNLDVSYRNKGKLRFYTPRIRELLAQLEHLEDQREDCIFPFLSKLFKEFHSHQASFRALIRCVSEVDALQSLAAASQALSGASCRAQMVALEPDAPATVELRNCRHPVVAAKMGNGFVPNDTFMNSCGVPGILIVTGPNMGGKSTVLRQTCVAVIMAQIGCRVNASSCRLSPVNRIFTRIGAYDAVLEGKSTLLTELEETASLLLHGTPRSLAVLDELGRGTATFDGAAIARAVLTELKQLRCPVMFATHYHPISKEAVKDTLKVAPFHMAAAVNNQSNDMTFLYKFLPGLCPASHGHNVAQIAGLPDKVLREARQVSAEFEGGPAQELLSCAKDGESALKELFKKRKAPGQ